MGRSGYSEYDGYGPPPELWQQAVANAIKGRRSTAQRVERGENQRLAFGRRADPRRSHRQSTRHALGRERC